MNIEAKTYGFSLIELMVAVAIVGILAGIAYPSYQEYVGRSNRAEAQYELMLMANRMEQFFLDNRAYTQDMRDLGVGQDPMITESGRYSIDATVNGGSFILTATARQQQLNLDKGCRTLSVSDTGQKTATDSSNNATNDCWEQ